MKRWWDIWQNGDKIPAIARALGKAGSVFGGKTPGWFPLDYRSVLDVGCGTGVFYPFLSANGAQYAGVDTSPHMLAMAQKKYPNATFELDDLLNLNRKDKAFDLVWCNCVLIHLPVIRAVEALRELRRVAAKYVIVNAYVGDRTFSEGNPEYYGIVQVWGRDDAGYMIEQAFDKKAEVVEDSLMTFGNTICRTHRYLVTL